MLETVYEWRNQWQPYDPDCTGRIKCTYFLETLICAPEPAGFGGKSSMENPDRVPNSEETFIRLSNLHLVASRGKKGEQGKTWKEWLMSFFASKEVKLEVGSDLEQLEENNFQNSSERVKNLYFTLNSCIFTTWVTALLFDIKESHTTF